MSTRTKEEELALDEKIARIQRKNEEILRRQKEIEEDKRMAEQQNAIVKLRPSSTNVSRERTPALKPSNRELRHDITEDFPLQEPPLMQRSSRGSFRGRGSERSRGQGDWKANDGPPPDPRSFLYDDERDGPTKDNTEQKRDPERGRREERDNRDNFRGGGREFQRGRRRGGMEYRGDRGRRGGGRRNEEEEWRAERLKIDEARIQRQKAADGRWRREWDSDKVLQESVDEPRHEIRNINTPHQEKWSPPSQYHGQFQTSPDRHTRHPSRAGRIIPRGGRGRGRLDPAELEMPLEKFQVEILQSQTSPGFKPSSVFTATDNFSSPPSGGTMASAQDLPLQDDFKLDPTRSVECVGKTVKISIPNVGAAQSTPKPQRQPHETRGRLKSQASYSSQSDDDTPRDRSHRGGRKQRNQKAIKGQDKTQYEPKNYAGNQISAKPGLETLPVQNKPPLPPFRAEQKPLTELEDSIEVKDGDESWEDVTTSGTESMGEDLSSVHSSPLRKTIVNTMVISGKQSETLATAPVQSFELLQNQPFDEDVRNSYEEYLDQLEKKEADKNFEGASELQQSFNTSEGSSANISLDTSDNFLLLESVSEELADHEKLHSVTAVPDILPYLVPEELLTNVPKEETIEKFEYLLKSVEQDTASSAKEECLELTTDLELYSKEETDKVVKVEVESAENLLTEQYTGDVISPDATHVGEAIQIFSDDKNVTGSSQSMTDDSKNTTSRDSTAGGEVIQIISDDKDVSASSQLMTDDSNKTDEKKADEKVLQLRGAEDV